ncbi:hypothetical protein EYY60_11285 [Flavobacterium zhairuonense]|uniref:hypothetical protein n=1 Tax=Flavobacterium zhairuonense TaxID=2493631 RepID=UPI001050F534|nr:hypothetical protein [Flavobacterium zhairuonense]KAF2510089.1 hypothetical protein EYY60_11285 [Flavobacterium zhairuonense]
MAEILKQERMNHYEQSGLVFYSERNYMMASNLFIQGLEAEPKNSMLWYGVGDSLCHISINANQEQLYPIGLSCVKKSYLLDTNNKYASTMLERMKSNPKIGEEYIDKLEPANLDLVQKFKLEVSNDKLISYFNQIQNIESKIKLVMHLGETKNKSYLEFLKYCILSERNSHIRFAALKRIPFHKGESLKHFFEELISKNQQDELEPYFSIALSSIKEDWTEKYIKSEFANTDKINNSFTEEEINNSLKNDEVKAVIALSLIKYDKQDIEKLYKERNQKILAFYLSNGLNDDGIDFLFKSRILDNSGNILEIGWKHIEQFLQIDFSIDKKIEKTKTEPEKIPTKPILTDSKKKWWELWK